MGPGSRSISRVRAVCTAGWRDVSIGFRRRTAPLEGKLNERSVAAGKRGIFLARSAQGEGGLACRRARGCAGTCPRTCGRVRARARQRSQGSVAGEENGLDASTTNITNACRSLVPLLDTWATGLECAVVVVSCEIENKRI